MSSDDESRRTGYMGARRMDRAGSHSQRVGAGGDRSGPIKRSLSPGLLYTYRSALSQKTLQAQQQQEAAQAHNAIQQQEQMLFQPPVRGSGEPAWKWGPAPTMSSGGAARGPTRSMDMTEQEHRESMMQREMLLRA